MYLSVSPREQTNFFVTFDISGDISSCVSLSLLSLPLPLPLGASLSHSLTLGAFLCIIRTDYKQTRYPCSAFLPNDNLRSTENFFLFLILISIHVQGTQTKPDRICLLVKRYIRKEESPRFAYSPVYESGYIEVEHRIRRRRGRLKS